MGRTWRLRPSEEEGQSSLEWVAVAIGMVAVLAALVAIVRLGADGTLGKLATQAASHAIRDGSPTDALQDALMY